MSIYSSFEHFKNSQSESIQVRPDSIRVSIDKRFQEIVHTEQTSRFPYIFMGDSSYVFTFFNATLDIGETLPALFPQEHFVYRILDVGTGDGTFITAQSTHNRQVIGIAADDKLVRPDVPRNALLLGNAEHLHDMQQLEDNSFDLIISKQTLKHFVDPIGFIERAVNKLCQGGYLLVDDFMTPGLKPEDVLLLVTYLQSQGQRLVIDFDFTTQGIKGLMIQKNYELKMPLHYSDVLDLEGLACYELNEFVHQHRNTYISDLFDAIMAQYRSTSRLKWEHKDFLSICRSEKFKRLSFEDKDACLKTQLLLTETAYSFFGLLESALKGRERAKEPSYHNAPFLFASTAFSDLSSDEHEQQFKQAIALDIWIAYQYDIVKKMGLAHFELPVMHTKSAFDPDTLMETGLSIPRPNFS